MGQTERHFSQVNLFDLFPRLTDENHEITSPETIKYNCVAWAVHNTNRWWQPGLHWPIEASREDHGIGNLVSAFKSLGYEECDDGTLEHGLEKIALYGTSLLYTHVARQLTDGKWTSKLGQLVDIVHTTVEAVAGSDYGEVIQFMKRRIE